MLCTIYPYTRISVVHPTLSHSPLTITSVTVSLPVPPHYSKTTVQSLRSFACQRCNMEEPVGTTSLGSVPPAGGKRRRVSTSSSQTDPRFSQNGLAGRRCGPG